MGRWARGMRWALLLLMLRGVALSRLPSPLVPTVTGSVVGVGGSSQLTEPLRRKPLPAHKASL